MTVGGVQQVMLHVKIMEVSRTKLRQLGFDWAKITGSNIGDVGPSGLIVPPSIADPAFRWRTPPAAAARQQPLPGLSPSTSPTAAARFSACWTHCGRTTWRRSWRNPRW